jgi:hypothetical protein
MQVLIKMKKNSEQPFFPLNKIMSMHYLLFFLNEPHNNSNSLANQLDIHLILAKREKLASNSLANQLGKNRNLAKLTWTRAYMRARIMVAICVSL